MGSWWSVNFEFSLAPNLIDWSLIGELLHELVGLDIDILLAWWCLWCFDITSEELLSCFGSLLLQAFWVVLSLVCLEELVWISTSWDDHGGVGRSTEHSLIVCNVLWEVLFLPDLTIGILIFSFLWNNTGMGCETWRRPRLLRHHFLF